MRFARHICLFLLVSATAHRASAFALLGPFAPWMTAQLSYQDGDSIGGPMEIGQGYRWNVPIITYDFDQSFQDYFGPKGVAAVESAIKIFNDLPPASAINLTNYPLYTSGINYSAESQSLVDLKSMALTLLVEQMGLAQPTRFTYCLTNFALSDVPLDYRVWLYYTNVAMRNYDPVTFEPSPFVNGVLYEPELSIDGLSYFFYYSPYGPPPPPMFADVTEFSAEGYDLVAVADGEPSGPSWESGALYNLAGQFYTGLTRDDVGGLRYLLNTNNVAPESLLPDVRGVGVNRLRFVNRTLRPGVNKITFQRMTPQAGTGRYRPVSYVYEDTYITNHVIQRQRVERSVTRPDILFTIKDLDYSHYVRMTGTSNWVNNGAPFQQGPGVIQPQIEIAFNRLGPSLAFYSPIYPWPYSYAVYNLWGSFDGSTNAPVVYPVSSGKAKSTKFYIWLLPGIFTIPPIVKVDGHSWNLTGEPNAFFSLQTSSNLTDWVTIATITNLGGTFTYLDSVYTNTPSRFFRTVPR